MTYQVLARKWRPRRFGEVVGQQHVLTALVNALAQGRLHHAYLFSGTRGVGKTSIARLLAKALNCETGVTADPCGQCASCQEIEQGRFVDLLEIDAASRTKVEDTRELLDNVQYQPARGRFKVYLIDEVHMLSRHSFNALLKTLEEPPPHVKFLLATTDPQKLPITILSRCLQFHLKSLEPGLIDGQLQHILQQERLDFAPEATAALARAADGSLRDALSLTDQALAFGNGRLALAEVERMLGNLNREQLLALVEAVLAGDGAALLARVAELASLGPDYDHVHKELIAFWHQLALAQVVPAQGVPHADELNRLAPLVSPDQIQLYYQICLQGRKDLPFAPDGRSALEMTLLRTLAFVPQSAAASAPTIAAPRPEPAPAKKPEPAATPAAVMQAESDEAMTARLEQEQAQIWQEAARMGKEMDSPVSEPAPVPPVVEPDAAPVAAQAASPQAVVPEAQTHAAPLVDEAAEQAARIRRLLQTRNRLLSQERTDTAAPPEPKVRTAPARPAMAVAAAERPVAPAPEASPEPRRTPPVFETPAAEQHNELPPLDAYSDMAWDDSDAPPWESESAPPPAAPSRPVKPAPAPARTAAGRAPPKADPAPPAVSPSVPRANWKITDGPEPLRPSQLLPQAEDDWARLVSKLPVGGLLRQLAMHSTLEQHGDQWQLWLRPAHKHLLNDKTREELQAMLAEHAGRAITLAVALGERGQTPAEVEQQLYAAARARAKDEIEADDAVQFLIARFAAELDADSIEPMANVSTHQ
ncbi:DNA polymerase III, subunits gamma and tau [Oceanimonas sp. GK1]|uniref:DNA polymerase III subunit gamma/tau n=1 Tax=Oceanimonas sp. (strain GK1 / IBRC-M 10197) TaxID=511062 RepID=UPI00024955C2|nr:DNA polymerase III subunit gamma/tau [Oceanimonas sp. GK1]AEY02058.1 DNA polymerase III, subunits gamma and tau [Oceanimonas sp. GK1]